MLRIRQLPLGGSQADVTFNFSIILASLFEGGGIRKDDGGSKPLLLGEVADRRSDGEVTKN